MSFYQFNQIRAHSKFTQLRHATNGTKWINKNENECPHKLDLYARMDIIF